MKKLSLMLLSIVFIVSTSIAGYGAAEISGTIHYAGTHTGTIVVAACTNPDFSDHHPAMIELAFPGSYTIPDLADGTYYLASVMSTPTQDGLNIQKTDPWGAYGTWENPTPVTITGGSSVSGIDITLIDGTEENPNPFYEEEELYHARAHSQNWSYGNDYIVHFEVEDSDHTATSVEITGPGITGSLRLDYDNNDEDWNSGHTNKNLYFSSSPPTPPLTYTFTIVDPDSTTVKTDIVERYIICATGLSPSNGETITGPLSFSWTGVGPGYTYRVQLNDANRNRIWDSDEDLTTTSVSYNGPALTPRAEYFYYVVVEDEYRNSSFAEESFVYQTAGQALTHWSTDPNVNNAICTQAGNQEKPTICSDGAGGAIITWQDGRIGYSDIYAQRIDASGVVQWTADGVAICTAAGNQERPALCSDGSGGAIITWYDDRGVTWNDIYAQRINASGVVQWTTNGVAISTAAAAGDQEGPTICSDGAGGAIITWGDHRGGGDIIIYAQRINASGVVQWTANGVAIGTTDSYSYNFTITSDGAGGEIITWEDLRSGVSDIYSQRINASGAVQWTANGVAICTAAGNQERPAIVSDGAGGAIITWYDDRSGISYDIYAQCVNASGVVQWTANGVAISTAANHQDRPTIASDGAGGAIITWFDLRSGNNYDIYSQRINASGAVQWTANGVTISTAANGPQGNPSIPAIISDGAGGAIINYTSGDNPPIYAQRINTSGVVQWTANGVAICTAGSCSSPTIVSDGAGGAIITWEDFRSGNGDIYAQQVGADGTLGLVTGVNEDNNSLPTTFTLEQNYPNPFNSVTTIEFSVPLSEFVTLKVFNMLGEKVAILVDREVSSGSHTIAWDASGFASGLYFYRLEAVSQILTKKLLLMK